MITGEAIPQSPTQMAFFVRIFVKILLLPYHVSLIMAFHLNFYGNFISLSIPQHKKGQEEKEKTNIN